MVRLLLSEPRTDDRLHAAYSPTAARVVLRKAGVDVPRDRRVRHRACVARPLRAPAPTPAHEDGGVRVVGRLLGSRSRARRPPEGVAGQPGDRPDLERRADHDEQRSPPRETLGTGEASTGSSSPNITTPGLRIVAARGADRRLAVVELREHVVERSRAAREAREARGSTRAPRRRRGCPRACAACRCSGSRRHGRARPLERGERRVARVRLAPRGARGCAARTSARRGAGRGGTRRSRRPRTGRRPPRCRRPSGSPGSRSPYMPAPVRTTAGPRVPDQRRELRGGSHVGHLGRVYLANDGRLPLRPPRSACASPRPTRRPSPTTHPSSSGSRRPASRTWQRFAGGYQAIR